MESARAEVANLPQGTRSPVATLVYAPPIELPNARQNQSTIVELTGDDQPQWIDVGFRINAEGQVRDYDVVRQSKNARGTWLDLVERSITRRVYRPLALAQDAPGLARIERYSLIYDVASAKNSRVRVRSSRPRIEVTDLTIDAPTG